MVTLPLEFTQDQQAILRRFQPTFGFSRHTGGVTTEHQTAAAELERVAFEVKKVIVGQDHMVERLIVAMLSQGHILLEGLPGVAKTLAVSTLSQVVGGTFARLQFTPDLLPSDLTGTRIWRGSDETFDIEWGPVFVNFLLIDEINRAPAKVQSALLEVMAERQVSIAGETRALPKPFLVLATQNPVESEGVYTLPEAQRDRFLMKVVVGYPSPVEELEIARRSGAAGVPTGVARIQEMITTDRLIELQGLAQRVYVDTSVAQYAVDLVMASREPELRGLPELAKYIEFGVSPRATLGLIDSARSLALMRGRGYVVPQDVFDMARDVLRHRLMLTYEALAEDRSADDILNRILSIVPAADVTTARPEPTMAAQNGNSYASTQASPSPPAGASTSLPTGQPAPSQPGPPSGQPDAFAGNRTSQVSPNVPTLLDAEIPADRTNDPDLRHSDP
ncbi:MAG: MoxR family ATPase [Acidimicrobiales bacterium]|nr:MoxR family ATPase [Acidimicrobiales bacterium]